MGIAVGRIRKHVTYLAYMGNPQQPQERKRLVVGTSTGHLVVAKHDVVGYGLMAEKCLLHGCGGRAVAAGGVEAVELLGSVLIVADGGAHGRITLLDWETGALLYDPQIHPGRLHHGRIKLCSAVIDMTFCHERSSSLICLCRDGYVDEWSVRCAFERAKKGNQKKNRQRSTLPNY
jgi:hypothetical protein